MKRFLQSVSGFRFWTGPIAIALCWFAVTPVHSTGFSVRGNDPGVVKSWADEYDSLANNLSASRGLSKQAENAAASVAANPQSLLFPSDRTPLDVILRRTEALLLDIKKMSGAPNMSSFERRLQALKAKPAGLAKTAGAQAQKDAFMEASLLRREIAFANPLLNFDSLIFVRWTSRYQHIQEAYGNTLLSQGGLFMLSGLQTGAIVTKNLLTNVTFATGQFAGRKILDFKGAVRSFDLSYDAKRIVFAWTPYTWENSDKSAWPPDKNDSMKLRICVMNVDGTNLKIITDGKYNDLDPVWLPNGRIAFVSGRLQLTVRCNMGPYAAQVLLYSMKDDGTDVTRLSYHETNERCPSVDNNGKLQYTRWDYIDRDMCAAQNLWQCNPDGRDPRAWHGNYPEPNQNLWYTTTDARTQRPWAEYYPRAIPGSDKIAAIASAHHTPMYGLPIIIDLSVKDDNKMSQVKVLTPGGLPLAGEPSWYNGRGMWQGCGYISVKNDYCYWEPWPLSETYFLIPWGTNTGVMSQPQMGAMQENFTTVPMQLYILDAMGNRTLVNSCGLTTLGGNLLNARPYRARTVPQNIATQTYDGERSSQPQHMRATLSILNVRIADKTLPANVAIKKLRIVQVFPRHWAEPDIENPRTGWSEGGICRASMGTVPVESDGSVYCDAPVNKGLYFQLLDSNGCAVQTMRSLTYVHPGENLSCTGCHEDKWAATPVGQVPIAWKRAPSTLTKEPGSQVPVTFGTVAPIFQNTCLPCHKSQNKGLQDFTYTDPNVVDVGTAYRFPDTNDKTKLVNYCWWNDASNSGDGLGPYGGYRSTPYKFGFMYSRLGRHLMAPGNSCKVPDTMLQKVKLWLDLNCMKYGNPTHVTADVNAQLTGSGDFTWPIEMSKSNPTGVELDRPQPSSTAIIAEWLKRGLIFQDDASKFRMIRFSGRNICEITGVQGPAKVSVVDLAGRMLLSHILAPQDKKSVYRFSMGAIAGKTASAILFVNVTAGTQKQTEKYVLLGNR
jgi:hypothetical protein